MRAACRCIYVRSGCAGITYSGWSDSKLALPIYQAVLDHSKEARISIGGTDTNYGGAQVHILKHRLLQTRTTNEVLLQHFPPGHCKLILTVNTLLAVVPVN